MSMLSEVSCRPPAAGCAKYVGRVGALAVALGIGSAIASGSAMAHADDGASNPSSESSASSASAGSNDAPAPKKSGPTSDEKSEDQKSETTATAESDDKPSKIDTAPERTAAAVATTEPKKPKRSSIDEPAASADVPSVKAVAADVTPMKPATTSTPSAEQARRSALVQPAAAIATASPLGTTQQLEAERAATRTVETWPVALMKLVLQFGFLSAAQQQFSQIGGPDQGNRDQLAAAVDEYAMGAAFQQQILDSNDPTVVMQVAPPHTWYGQTVPGSRILYDNPDTIYRFMGVNAASSYVINGQFTGDRPADTTFSVLTGFSGNTASVLGGHALVVDPDGSFTVTASRDAAAPGQTNHLQLTDDSTLIATRNTLSDWGTEVPMTLTIERVGGPPNSLFSQLGGFALPGIGSLVVRNPLLTTLVSLIPPMADPPPLLRGTIAAVIMALGIQREATYMSVATTDPQTGRTIPPNVLKNPTRNAEFLATQLQSAGYFQLADDETLVVTIDPGSAGYFVLPVTNDWTISKDYRNQQTSLNDSQAIANADGTYTLVVAKSDPGVANWVSTGGLNQGTISMRFQDFDAGSSHLPTVSSQVVSLAQLPAAVPPGTAYYTAQQRAEQLAARKTGYDNRFAPYPQP